MRNAHQSQVPRTFEPAAAPDDILPQPQSENSSDQNETEWPGEAIRAECFEWLSRASESEQGTGDAQEQEAVGMTEEEEEVMEEDEEVERR